MVLSSGILFFFLKKSGAPILIYIRTGTLASYLSERKKFSHLLPSPSPSPPPPHIIMNSKYDFYHPDYDLSPCCLGASQKKNRVGSQTEKKNIKCFFFFKWF